MSKSFGLQLLQQKPLTDPKVSFAGKTVIVTGSNSGLGFEAAAKFVALDASRVILGIRDAEKGSAARRAIEERTGREGHAEVWQLDMNSYDSIRAFADRASRLDRLDVALLNAGVYMVDYQKSLYGWEETLQVNTISTALLSLLLLPKLRSSCTELSLPVLEFVSSRRAEAAVLPATEGSILEALNDQSQFSPSVQYRSSKLLAMCIAQKLAASVQSSEVAVTAVCPGAAASNLSRGWSGFIPNMLKAILNALFMRTTEEGARSLVSGTTLGSEGHGKFWYDDQVHSLLPPTVTEDIAAKVWTEVLGALQKDVGEDLDAMLKRDAWSG
ncbi:putative Short-chain dehydrogenase [Pleurostoma richardsiae]|uniref:Short-chain dehydrogenase n=1 Tax=Pleurostoma richardsiae TaxID=41990 RepID=A0AA38W0T0_9PEZI|nr:putative Short-chain dehydrogenase [Pleurostoma richardsiae]